MFEFRARGDGGSTDLRQQYQRAAKLGEIWNREVSVQPSPFTWPHHIQTKQIIIYMFIPPHGAKIFAAQTVW